MTTVHQPYFLPWLGFFSKLCYSDKYIVLDNVEFSKGFYYDRTKYINMDGSVKWLSIPTGQHYKEYLGEILINDIQFLEKFFRSIEMSYSKANFFKENWPQLKEILTFSFQNNSKLINVNISIIKLIMDMLKIDQPIFLHSSYYNTNLEPTDRIISLCHQTKSSQILIGDGSSLKYHNWKLVQQNNIEVNLQPYYEKHPIYKQVRRQKLPFMKGVSILDAILNIGIKETNELLFIDELKPKILKNLM